MLCDLAWMAFESARSRNSCRLSSFHGEVAPSVSFTPERRRLSGIATPAGRAWKALVTTGIRYGS